jgi:hypothetical protein
MKRFNELTDLEKIGLTEVEIEQYTKVECAYRGIIIPVPPKEKPKTVFEPSAKFFAASYSGPYFSCIEDAEDYNDTMKKSFSGNTIAGDYNKPYYAKPADKSGEVSTKLLYTQEEAKELEEVFKYNKQLDLEWKGYHEAVKGFNDVHREIYDEILDLKYKKERGEYYAKVFQDYIDLANGDNNIGFTFFEKAYKSAKLSDVDRDIVDEILNNRQ